MVNRKHDDVPQALTGKDDAIAEFGILKPYIATHVVADGKANEIAADAALSIWKIILSNRVVGYWDNLDAQRRTMNDIDDYLYDQLKGKHGMPLTPAEMDEIIHRSMELARHRAA